MFVKVELKLLIGKVDAELFKAVMLVIFKSKNVQNSYRASLKSQRGDAFKFINKSVSVRTYTPMAQ